MKNRALLRKIARRLDWRAGRARAARDSPPADRAVQSRELHVRDARRQARSGRLPVAGSDRAPQHRGFAADRRGKHAHAPAAAVPRPARRRAASFAGRNLLALDIPANTEARPAPAAVDGDPIIHAQDVLCGSIAVLVVLHHDWLTADPARIAWCRRKLAAVLEQPPSPFRFDSETASGECKWDTFAAEAGVALLARNRDDALARRLAAIGVIGFHYSTSARTMLSACRHRERLGDDFRPHARPGDTMGRAAHAARLCNAARIDAPTKKAASTTAAPASSLAGCSKEIGVGGFAWQWPPWISRILRSGLKSKCRRAS